MDSDILRSVSGLIHMWKLIRYESDMCICACRVSGLIGYSPVNATPTSLKSQLVFFTFRGTDLYL